VAEHATEAYAAHGWELVGAWRTAMHDDAECVLIWAIPSWEQWADLEKAVHYRGGLSAWRDLVRARTTGFERILMMDAPLCPLRIGRQPARSDRAEGWDDL
jgi:hypothetical protein